MDGLQGGINMDKNTKKMNGEVSQGSYVLRTALAGAVFSFLLYVILIGRSYADILLTFDEGRMFSNRFLYFAGMSVTLVLGLLLAGIVVKNPGKAEGGGLKILLLSVILGILGGAILSTKTLSMSFTDLRISIHRGIIELMRIMPYETMDFLYHFDIMRYLADGVILAILGFALGILEGFLIYIIRPEGKDTMKADIARQNKLSRARQAARQYAQQTGKQNAKQAPQPTHIAASEITAGRGYSVEEEIRKYQMLVDADVMTQEEFEKKKEQLMRSR